MCIAIDHIKLTLAQFGHLSIEELTKKKVKRTNNIQILILYLYKSLKKYNVMYLFLLLHNSETNQSILKNKKILFKNKTFYQRSQFL